MSTIICMLYEQLPDKVVSIIYLEVIILNTLFSRQASTDVGLLVMLWYTRLLISRVKTVKSMNASICFSSRSISFPLFPPFTVSLS